MTDYWPLPGMVEAPGTAPGSEWFIPTAIYRHSRQAGTANIGGNGRRRKSGRTVLFKESDPPRSPVERKRNPGADSRVGRPPPIFTALIRAAKGCRSGRWFP